MCPRAVPLGGAWQCRERHGGCACSPSPAALGTISGCACNSRCSPRTVSGSDSLAAEHSPPPRPACSSMMFGFGDKGTTNLMTRALASVGECGVEPKNGLHEPAVAKAGLLVLGCVQAPDRSPQMSAAPPTRRRQAACLHSSCRCRCRCRCLAPQATCLPSFLGCLLAALAPAGKRLETVPDPTQIHYHLPPSARHPNVRALRLPAAGTCTCTLLGRWVCVHAGAAWTWRLAACGAPSLRGVAVHCPSACPSAGLAGQGVARLRALHR